jgi:serine/threonine protein kinase
MRLSDHTLPPPPIETLPGLPAPPPLDLSQIDQLPLPPPPEELVEAPRDSPNASPITGRSAKSNTPAATPATAPAAPEGNELKRPPSRAKAKPKGKSDIYSMETIRRLKLTVAESEEIDFKRKIGSGAYAEVWLSRYGNTDVAVKKFRTFGDPTPELVREFKAESALLVSLKPHPNIVAAFGVCVDPLSIILEYVALGSLKQYIADNYLPTHEIRHILLGIANGMAFLHEQRIVHRDLSARNVLLGFGFNPKITDFGLSRIVDSQSESEYATTQSNLGPVRWMAPEAIVKRHYSTKSDVWSYGCVLSELLERADPYPEKHTAEVIVFVTAQNGCPNVASTYPPCLQTLMKACFQALPAKRPSFGDVLELLQNSPISEFEEWSTGEDSDSSPESSFIESSPPGMQQIAEERIKQITTFLAAMREKPSEQIAIKEPEASTLVAIDNRLAEVAKDLDVDTGILINLDIESKFLLLKHSGKLDEMVASPVTEWLESIGLSQYAVAFWQNSYDTVERVRALKESELSGLGVETEHRSLLLQAGKSVHATAAPVAPAAPPAAAAAPSVQDGKSKNHSKSHSAGRGRKAGPPPSSLPAFRIQAAPRPRLADPAPGPGPSSSLVSQSSARVIPLERQTVRIDVQIVESTGSVLPVKRGWLDKLHGNKWKRRFFAIRDGCLYRFKDESEKKQMDLVFLGLETSVMEYEPEKYPTSFQVQIDAKKSVVLKADNEFEMQGWLNAVWKHKIFNEQEHRTSEAPQSQGKKTKASKQDKQTTARSASPKPKKATGPEKQPSSGTGTGSGSGSGSGSGTAPERPAEKPLSERTAQNPQSSPKAARPQGKPPLERKQCHVSTFEFVFGNACRFVASFTRRSTLASTATQRCAERAAGRFEVPSLNGPSRNRHA